MEVAVRASHWKRSILKSLNRPSAVATGQDQSPRSQLPRPGPNRLLSFLPPGKRKRLHLEGAAKKATKKAQKSH